MLKSIRKIINAWLIIQEEKAMIKRCDPEYDLYFNTIAKKRDKIKDMKATIKSEWKSIINV